MRSRANLSKSHVATTVRRWASVCITNPAVSPTHGLATAHTAPHTAPRRPTQPHPTPTTPQHHPPTKGSGELLNHELNGGITVMRLAGLEPGLYKVRSSLGQPGGAWGSLGAPQWVQWVRWVRWPLLFCPCCRCVWYATPRSKPLTAHNTPRPCVCPPLVACVRVELMHGDACVYNLFTKVGVALFLSNKSEDDHTPVQISTFRVKVRYRTSLLAHTGGWSIICTRLVGLTPHLPAPTLPYPTCPYRRLVDHMH